MNNAINELDMKIEKAEKNLKSRKSLKRAAIHYNVCDAQILELKVEIKLIKKSIDDMYNCFDGMNPYIHPTQYIQDYYSNW